MVARWLADHFLIRGRTVRDQRRWIVSGATHPAAAELVGQRACVEALNGRHLAANRPLASMSSCCPTAGFAER